MISVRRIAYITLRAAFILHCYRRGNEVPLVKAHYAGADHYDERDANTCANDAVQYGTALANRIWEQSKGGGT